MPFSIVIDIDPIILQLGPLAFRWYGLMYVVGISVGLWLVYPFGRRRGITDDDFWAIVWPGVVAGFVGARLYYVAQQPLGPYLAEPWRIMATWEGGMAFYGAIFAVAATTVVVTRMRRISFWTVADVGCIFAVVGQAFGRIGNIINGDVVGPPTDLAWGFIYAHPGSFVADHSVAYHPAAVYELLFNVALFALLWSIRWRLPRPGLLFVIYLLGYSMGQFLLFFLRSEPLVALGLKQAQITALVVMAAALALGFWLMRRDEGSSRESSPSRIGAPRGPARLQPKRRKR
ncbi:MAG TPA: prolipoprotein diacylglyceryl transferase [Chloroflexota bacterium]|nr:prolipoprotein diacylglyceryl transferase [Chloroflexota bacterium]